MVLTVMQALGLIAPAPPVKLQASVETVVEQVWTQFGRMLVDLLATCCRWVSL